MERALSSTAGPPTAPLLGGLLVGGVSRRMGRAKALIELDGVALGERAAAALTPHVERVVLLGAGPVPGSLAGLERLPDAPLGGAADRGGAGGGPLAALLAALRAEPSVAWVLCPCDLPAVRPAAVGWLVDQRRPGRLAVMARRDAASPPEPLLALYEPAIRPAVEALAAGGGRAPHLLARLPGVAVERPPAAIADCWRDADRPADLDPTR